MLIALPGLLPGVPRGERKSPANVPKERMTRPDRVPVPFQNSERFANATTLLSTSAPDTYVLVRQNLFRFGGNRCRKLSVTFRLPASSLEPRNRASFDRPAPLRAHRHYRKKLIRRHFPATDEPKRSNR